MMHGVPLEVTLTRITTLSFGIYLPPPDSIPVLAITLHFRSPIIPFEMMHGVPLEVTLTRITTLSFGIYLPPPNSIPVLAITLCFRSPIIPFKRSYLLPVTPDTCLQAHPL